MVVRRGQRSTTKPQSVCQNGVGEETNKEGIDGEDRRTDEVSQDRCGKCGRCRTTASVSSALTNMDNSGLLILNSSMERDGSQSMVFVGSSHHHHHRHHPPVAAVITQTRM